jgi:large subunit ribosomal protein L23
MNPLSVLERPVLSEKSLELRDSLNQYTFRVNSGATSIEVKKALESLYGVKVLDVRTLVTRGKVKSRGQKIFKRSNFKKAVVTLEKGAKLPIFGDQ